MALSCRMPLLVSALLLCSALPPMAFAQASSTAAAPKGGTEGAAPAQRFVKASPTLVQRLRQLLNLAPPLAVGGSRSGEAGSVCLISPAPQALATKAAVDGSSEDALAVTPVAAPTLLAAGPLNEIRLQRNGVVLWQLRASSSQAIDGSILWPLAPLKPGERLQLLLRPRGASGGDFASVRLQAGNAAELERSQRLIVSLGVEQKPWLAAIERTSRSDRALAVALLTSPEAPAEIRAAALDLGCR